MTSASSQWISLVVPFDRTGVAHAFDPSALALVLALAIDFLWGEPHSRLHPVVGMGRLTRRLERRAPASGARAQLLYGALIALTVPLAFAGASAVALIALAAWPVARICALAWLLKTTFALRALGAAAREMRDSLDAQSLDPARQALRSLCSRDPSSLEREDLVGATVESLAENASDSFVAPLFYYALGGLPLAMAYRAINTLDAMIGYHGRYEHLGKFAARCDDIMNLVPARLTAALLLLGGLVLRLDARGGLSAWRDHARRTESPNAGRPMAVMAGLLGVELTKTGHYRLGRAREALTARKIDQAWRTVLAGGAFAAALTILGVELLHASGR